MQWQQRNPPFSHSRQVFGGQGKEGRGTVVLSFTGEHTQKVDGKGRMSIPADFRRVLEDGDLRGAIASAVRAALARSIRWGKSTFHSWGGT